MFGCAQASPVTPARVIVASAIERLGIPPGETLICRMVPVIGRLEQAEVHFNGSLNRNWHSLFLAGPEHPFLDRADCFLIQAKTEAAEHFNVPWVPVLVNDGEEEHGALVTG